MTHAAQHASHDETIALEQSGDAAGQDVNLFDPSLVGLAVDGLEQVSRVTGPAESGDGRRGVAFAAVAAIAIGALVCTHFRLLPRSWRGIAALLSLTSTTRGHGAYR